MPTMPAMNITQQLQAMGAPPLDNPEFAAWAAESKRDTVLITSWCFLSLATCIVVLRLYVRVGIYRNLLADDWWTLVATICGFVSAALTTVAVENGVGRHMPTLTNGQRENMIFFMTVAFCPAGFFYGLPKVAIVILLCRLIKPKPWLKWTLWTMVLWSILSLVVFMILQFTRCDPPSALWNLEMQHHCRDSGPIIDYAIYANIFSAFVDVVLAVYPAVYLSSLHISWRRKLGLMSALGIGAIGGGIAVYKSTIIPRTLSSPDFSFDGADLILWTAIEGCTMIIAASMPILAPLVDMFLNSRSRSRLLRPHSKSYKDLDNGSHEMGVRGSGSRRSDSQVDILHERNQGKEYMAGGNSPIILPGPGQIILTNEISVTYETRPVDPLEAMIRGYRWDERR